MKADNLLLTIAIIAVVVAACGVGFTYYETGGFWITGHGTTGIANLTVDTAASVNFTIQLIDWANGTVDDGKDSATLLSIEGANNVTDGSWILQTEGGFQIANIGNVNVSLNLSTNNTAATFLGGSSPSYQLNVTNLNTSACNGSAGYTVGEWTNCLTAGVMVCDVFQKDTDKDHIRIDLKLVVPSNSYTGNRQSLMTANIQEA